MTIRRLLYKIGFVLIGGILGFLIGFGIVVVSQIVGFPLATPQQKVTVFGFIAAGVLMGLVDAIKR